MNVFKLAPYYIKLLKALHQSVPALDPSLFVRRFCSKLNFGSKAQAVALTALRLVQSMTRDWLTIGRKPTGLCGAAIFIAAKLHGLSRPTRRVIEVVRVCEETLRKRVEEFSKTPAAALTWNKFQELDFDKKDEDDLL